jgi:DNA repair exonuclease SbcCD nuclease subunit
MEEERTPPCRLDSIWEAQWDKVKQIKALQIKYEIPIFLSGDLFDHWKTSPKLLNKTIEEMPEFVYTVIGNHDMPEHNPELIYKSGLETLFRSNQIDPFFVLKPHDPQGDWGRESKIKPIEYSFDRRIIVSHEMAYQGEPPYPGAEGDCSSIFKKYKGVDLIITGHNHKTFTARKGNQLLINPGSLTRHDADQVDHRPCVFLWQAKTNTFKIHYLKVKEDVISREHIEIQNQKKQNINHFLSKLKQSWEIGLSFEDNILRAFEENGIPKAIQEIILKWMGK